MFDTKTSQAELTKEFAIPEKKLHLVVSSRKYDPGKKLRKTSEKSTPAKEKKESMQKKACKMSQRWTK